MKLNSVYSSISFRRVAEFLFYDGIEFTNKVCKFYFDEMMNNFIEDYEENYLESYFWLSEVKKKIEWRVSCHFDEYPPEEGSPHYIMWGDWDDYWS